MILFIDSKPQVGWFDTPRESSRSPKPRGYGCAKPRWDLADSRTPVLRPVWLGSVSWLSVKLGRQGTFRLLMGHVFPWSSETSRIARQEVHEVSQGWRTPLQVNTESQNHWFARNLLLKRTPFLGSMFVFGGEGERNTLISPSTQTCCCNCIQTQFKDPPLVFQGPAKPGSFLILILPPTGNSALGPYFFKEEDQPKFVCVFFCFFVSCKPGNPISGRPSPGELRATFGSRAASRSSAAAAPGRGGPWTPRPFSRPRRAPGGPRSRCPGWHPGLDDAMGGGSPPPPAFFLGKTPTTRIKGKLACNTPTGG